MKQQFFVPRDLLSNKIYPEYVHLNRGERYPKQKKRTSLIYEIEPTKPTTINK
jgi:hypothetical protein